MDTTPPEESVFSLPPYKTGQLSSSSTNVQMNPALAIAQSTSKSTVAAIFKGLTIAVLALAVTGSGIWYFLSNTATSTQASIDLRQAVLGTVGEVKLKDNAFTLVDTKSEDPTITITGITNWLIQMPPGASLSSQAQAVLPICHTISDLNRNLNDAIETPCVGFLSPGDRVVIEYLVVKPESSMIITQKIIKERK